MWLIVSAVAMPSPALRMILKRSIEHSAVAGNRKLAGNAGRQPLRPAIAVRAVVKNSLFDRRFALRNIERLDHLLVLFQFAHSGFADGALGARSFTTSKSARRVHRRRDGSRTSLSSGMAFEAGDALRENTTQSGALRRSLRASATIDHED